MLKDYVSISIFVFNCYLCLGTLQIFGRTMKKHNRSRTRHEPLRCCRRRRRCPTRHRRLSRKLRLRGTLRYNTHAEITSTRGSPLGGWT